MVLKKNKLDKYLQILLLDRQIYERVNSLYYFNS